MKIVVVESMTSIPELKELAKDFYFPMIKGVADIEKEKPLPSVASITMMRTKNSLSGVLNKKIFGDSTCILIAHENMDRVYLAHQHSPRSRKRRYGRCGARRFANE